MAIEILLEIMHFKGSKARRDESSRFAGCCMFINRYNRIFMIYIQLFETNAIWYCDRGAAWESDRELQESLRNLYRD